MVGGVGFVPGVGDTDVEGAAVAVTKDTGQHVLAETVLVSDDPVVNPKDAVID
jgi:hypothetical protein